MSKSAASLSPKVRIHAPAILVFMNPDGDFEVHGTLESVGGGYLVHDITRGNPCYDRFPLPGYTVEAYLDGRVPQGYPCVPSFEVVGPDRCGGPLGPSTLSRGAGQPLKLRCLTCSLEQGLTPLNWRNYSPISCAGPSLKGLTPKGKWGQTLWARMVNGVFPTGVDGEG